MKRDLWVSAAVVSLASSTNRDFFVVTDHGRGASSLFSQHLEGHWSLALLDA
jgi:hypothetical protein